MDQEGLRKTHKTEMYNSTMMCVQYRGGCSVQWGCSAPWGVVQYRGGIMMHVGDILSAVGDVQYRGGYHDKCEGISCVLWGDIMSTVGGYLEYRGRYHDARGGIS